MSLIHNVGLKIKSRELRKASTLAEVLLWQRFKGRQLLGYKFRRQTLVGNYIVDFFCYELMLAIEIDGTTHFQKEGYDKQRQSDIEKLGIKFLRFGDTQVKQNLAGVVDEIIEWINKHAHVSGGKKQTRSTEQKIPSLREG